MSISKIQAKLDKLNTEVEQLKAQRQRIQAQWNATEKKQNNRRKFVVGALILKDLEHDTVKKYIADLLSNSPERDRNLFPELIELMSPPQATQKTNP